MASINLSGVWRDSVGDLAYKNRIRFTHLTNTGETISGTGASKVIEIDGAYDFDLEYGNVFIETFDYTLCKWTPHGAYTINSDTLAGDLVTLLGITTPLTDDQLLIVQALVADAANSASEAETIKEETQVIKDETEALFDDFDNSVAESLNVVSGIDWDVEVDFNDGLEIKKGYGNRDSNGNKAVDFSRASATGNINKSGVYELLTTDEVSISDGGAWFLDSFTNWSLYNNEIDNAWWSKASATVAATGETVLGSLVEYKVELTSGTGFRNIRRVATSDYSLGDNLGVTVIAKAMTIESFTINIGSECSATFNLTSGSVTSSTGDYKNAIIESAGDGYYKCFLSYTSTVSDTDQIIRVMNLTGDVGDYINICYANITNSLTPAGLSVNTTASTAEASASTSIPVLGNMPATGRPFSIHAVIDAPEKSNTGRSIVNIPGDNTLVLRFDADGLTYLATSQDSLTIPGLIAGGEQRFIMSYDGNLNATLYVDGVKKGELAMTSPIEIDYTGSVYIGQSSSAWRLKGKMKNFKIKFSETTDEQAAAMGAPK